MVLHIHCARVSARNTAVTPLVVKHSLGRGCPRFTDSPATHSVGEFCVLSFSLLLVLLRGTPGLMSYMTNEEGLFFSRGPAGVIVIPERDREETEIAGKC